MQPLQYPGEIPRPGYCSEWMDAGTQPEEAFAVNSQTDRQPEFRRLQMVAGFVAVLLLVLVALWLIGTAILD